MGEIAIRQFELGDPVAEIHERALRDAGGYVDPDELPEGIDPDADLRDVESHYLDAGGVFLVAERRDETGGSHTVVGTGALAPVNDDVAEVTRMRVLPSYQGQGIGRRLLHELESRGRARGFTEFVLDTAPHLEAAQALYESEGYEQAGYVETPWTDLIIYRKQLATTPKDN